MKRSFTAEIKSGFSKLFPFANAKEKLSFSEDAQRKLGLRGLEDEELMQALISAYKEGFIVDVYQILLNEKVNCDSFYHLQAEAWGVAARIPKINALKDPAEQMVRAIAHMAKDRMGK